MSGILTSVHDGRIMIDDGCDSIDIAVSDWAELKATIDKMIDEVPHEKPNPTVTCREVSAIHGQENQS